MSDAATISTDTEAPVKDTSFLADLEEFGAKLIPAELPGDVRKVLGGLIHWVDNSGSFDGALPATFNASEAQAISQQDAENDRLQSALDAQAAQIAKLEAAIVANPTATSEPAASSTHTPAVPGVTTEVEAPALVTPPEDPAPATPPASA